MATVTCQGDTYPSRDGVYRRGTGRNNNPRTSTCKSNFKEPAYWDNGKIKCVPGNENINTPDAISAQG